MSDDHHTGLYDKYRVTRIDGSSGPGRKHEACRFFVLDWNHDPYALIAARAYADACELEYPELAASLRHHVAVFQVNKAITG